MSHAVLLRDALTAGEGVVREIVCVRQMIDPRQEATKEFSVA